jgi:hypothetical protein
MTLKFYEEDYVTTTSGNMSNIKYGIEVVEDSQQSQVELNEELLKSILIKQNELYNQTSLILRILVNNHHSINNNISQAIKYGNHEDEEEIKNRNWFTCLLIKIMTIFKTRLFQ